MRKLGIVKLAKCKTITHPETWERYGWIVESVARRYGVSVNALLGYGKWSRLAAARRELYVCLWGSGLAYIEIGRMLGKDHTSIMYGVKKALAS